MSCDLEQTKLIQLITLQGIDNYIHDHGECVERAKMLEQLPEIVDYLSQVRLKRIMPDMNMESILKFESKSAYYVPPAEL